MRGRSSHGEARPRSALLSTDGVDFGAGAAYVLQAPKPTPTPPPAIGGVALDSDVRLLPLETADSGSSQSGFVAAIVAAAGLLVTTGAALYARKRSLR